MQDFVDDVNSRFRKYLERWILKLKMYLIFLVLTLIPRAIKSMIEMIENRKSILQSFVTKAA